MVKLSDQILAKNKTVLVLELDEIMIRQLIDKSEKVMFLV